MDDSQRRQELSQIEKRSEELEKSLEQAELEDDEDRIEEINERLKKLASDYKHCKFKLGEYRYPEDETVEVGGQVMPANVYHMLKE